VLSFAVEEPAPATGEADDDIAVEGALSSMHTSDKGMTIHGADSLLDSKIEGISIKEEMRSVYITSYSLTTIARTLHFGMGRCCKRRQTMIAQPALRRVLQSKTAITHNFDLLLPHLQRQESHVCSASRATRLRWIPPR
jgi:hypothetical protein